MHFAHWSEAKGAWRWPFFTPREIASKGDGSVVVIPEALDALTAARELFGRPLVVLSAYRDPVHNARIGGAPLSRHKVGDAFDLRHNGEPDLLATILIDVGFTGIGYYRTFIHGDRRPRRTTWRG
jgi:uncharacterized protein YcbK (DUF882 family)